MRAWRKVMQPTAGFMTHVTCRLTAKNRDQLRNTTLSNRVRATFTFFNLLSSANEKATPTFIKYTILDLDTGRSHHHLHVVVGQVHANVSHRQLQLLPVDVAAPVLHITSCSHQNSAPSSMTAANKWSKNSAAYRLID